MADVVLARPCEAHEEAFLDMMREWEGDGGRIYPGMLRHWRGEDEARGEGGTNGAGGENGENGAGVACGENGAGGENGATSYARWLERVRARSCAETCGEGMVPADLYFLIDDAGRLYGAIDIRHALNEHLLRIGGHVGYGIRPSERRKGYAAYQLSLALPKLRALGVERALVTCNKGNVGSAKTILRNGGVLEDEVTEADGNVVQRYWIAL